MKTAESARGAQTWLRLIAFTIVNVALAAALLFGVVAPLVRWSFGEGDDLAERRSALARYQAVAAQEDAVREYVRQVKESNRRGDLFEGASLGVVTAALQARLKALGGAAGVSVLSIQALPLKALGPTETEAAKPNAASDPRANASRARQLIGARVSVSGALPAMHDFMRAIEAGPPLLLTTTAAMTQTMNWRPAMDDQEPMIQAQFDVYGGALSIDRP